MRSWTVSEEQALKAIAPYGARHAALVLDRSEYCVRMKASRLGISLKTKHGISDTRQLQAIVERIRDMADAPLCPRCGQHFVSVRKTGLCGSCHLELLTEAHLEELARVEAQRELWTARQRLKRARDAQ